MYRNRDKKGNDVSHIENDSKNIIVSEISRGDSFGGSNVFHCPGLDYLGDIVAGDQLLDSSDHKPVVCYYLSPSDFNYIPHYEIKLLT